MLNNKYTHYKQKQNLSSEFIHQHLLPILQY